MEQWLSSKIRLGNPKIPMECIGKEITLEEMEEEEELIRPKNSLDEK